MAKILSPRNLVMSLAFTGVAYAAAMSSHDNFQQMTDRYIKENCTTQESCATAAHLAQKQGYVAGAYTAIFTFCAGTGAAGTVYALVTGVQSQLSPRQRGETTTTGTPTAGDGSPKPPKL